MGEESKITALARLKEHKVLYEILSYAFWIVLAILLALLIRAFVTEKVVVEGTSMMPTYEDGEHLFIEKVSYRFHEADRFDVVVLIPPETEKYDHFIKRIIGLPGETVQIIDGCVYINGEKLDDPYASTPMVYAGLAEEPVVLGEDEYFVLGDNRTPGGSKDSREIGVVNADHIVGRVYLRVWPLNRFGLIG